TIEVGGDSSSVPLGLADAAELEEVPALAIQLAVETRDERERVRGQHPPRLFRRACARDLDAFCCFGPDLVPLRRSRQGFGAGHRGRPQARVGGRDEQDTCLGAGIWRGRTPARPEPWIARGFAARSIRTPRG